MVTAKFALQNRWDSDREVGVLTGRLEVTDVALTKAFIFVHKKTLKADSVDSDCKQRGRRNGESWLIGSVA